jgi:hypothetical protein
MPLSVLKIMNIRQQIIRKSIELLEPLPEGLRFSVLARQLEEALPEIKPKNIPATLVNLEKLAAAEIYKPAKGLFRHTKYKEDDGSGVYVPPVSPAIKFREEEFYEPFATWLVEDLEECTKAISVGGNKFKDKWGTPDVIGVLRPKPTDIFPFPMEIVSAEIKVDTYGLITAFGQACSYKLFSHKSYIVIPATSPVGDISRLDSLCLIFGLGLILFNSQNPKESNFSIKTRAVPHQPDMFYVNKHIREIADELLS